MKKSVVRGLAAALGLAVLLGSYSVLGAEPGGGTAASSVQRALPGSAPELRGALPVGSLPAGSQLPEVLALPPAPLQEGASPAGLSPQAVTLTSQDQLAALVPDAAFRKAIFDAVVAFAADEGDPTLLEGASFEEVLGKFAGDLDASREGISDVRGLQYLVYAASVDLSQNNISDWTQLSPSGNFSDSHYGYPSAAASPTGDPNVYWTIDRNPFTQLPSNFGGRLIINQMATHAYTYPQDQTPLPYSFIRGSAGQSFSMVVDVGRCRIRGNAIRDNDGVENGFIKLLSGSSHYNALLPGTQNIDASLPYTVAIETAPELNRYARLGGILVNGDTRLGIGTEQVIHCGSDDGGGAGDTPESDSFKYYLRQEITIYDPVTVTHSNYTGSVSFTKTDAETGAPLAGAVYSLYRGSTEVKSGLVTGADGKISVTNLQPGNYSFRETQAPEGYLLNSQPAAFALKADVEIGGGYKSVTASDGTTAEAGEHEVYMAGAGTPDVQILPVGGGAANASATVTYSGLKGEAAAVSRSFSSIQAAQADVNTEKNKNTITGPVTIDVRYADGMNETAATSQTNSPQPASSSSSSSTSSSSTSSSSSVSSSSTSPSSSLPSSSPAASVPPGGNSTTPQSPQTGDNAAVPAAFVALGGLSLCLGLWLLRRRKA